MIKGLSKTFFDLSNKVVVVTGAAGQLGGEYVKTLLDYGASVVALDIWFENPKSKINSIKSDKLKRIKTDITDKQSLNNALTDIISTFGSPNVLINNAAIDAPPNADLEETGAFETYSINSWDKTVEVNLKGTLLCCQVIGGSMAKNGGGSIINISSIYGMLSPDQRIYKYKKRDFFKPVSYSVSKSGVLNLTRYLATYWAEKNIRVNTLTLAGIYNKQDSEFLKNYCNKVPLGRMANENDYNGAIVFLSSEASAYMTGSNLIIDGGYSCW